MLKLSVREAESLADRMEANGDDASKIRVTVAEILGGAEPGGQPSLPKERVPDSVYVQTLWEQSRLQEGDGLICTTCGKETNILVSDVCETCFFDWALSTRKED